MYSLLTTWLISFAAFGQPLEVIVGDDLIAWQAIDEKQLDTEKLVANYQLFISKYPTSALSEVALARVQELQPYQAKSSHEAEQAKIAESHQLHSDRLERGLASTTIVELTADGSLPSPKPSPWHVALHAGASWMGDSFAGITGAEIRYRPIGVITRLGLGETTYLQTGLRVTAPGWGPFAEMSVDTRGALGMLAGGRHAVKHKLWLELSGGIEQLDGELSPAARLELVQGL